MQGFGNFNTTNNAPYSAGPPFPALAAENGLSVDPITGRIVLGNDFGNVDAQLLSTREIPMNGNVLFFTDDALNSLLQISAINGGSAVGVEAPTQSRVEMSAFNTGAFMSVESDSVLVAPPQFILNDISVIPHWITRLRQMGSEFQVFSDTMGGRSMLSLDEFFGTYQMGDADGVFAEGSHILIESGSGTFQFRNAVSGQWLQELNFGSQTCMLGDMLHLTTGTTELIDVAAGVHDFSNTALNAVYSCNGTPGFTGTVTPVTSITVVGGIVTAVS